MTHEARKLYCELALLSHGGTQAFDPAGGGSIPDSRPPTGESKPPHEMFAADYERKGTAAVPYWQGVLKAWRGEGRVAPKGKSDREIVLDAGKGYSPDDVSKRFRLTPSMVRKWRREAGVNEETGDGETQAETVRRLRSEGYTFRQIAALTGQSKSAVDRADKRKAEPTAEQAFAAGRAFAGGA